MRKMEENQECCRRSFAASLKDSAKRVLENPKLVPRSVRLDRLEICHSNECGRYLEKTDQCGICQCIMGIKTSFANMRCPLDKWTEWGDTTVEESAEPREN